MIYSVPSKFTLSPVEKAFQNRAAQKYKNDVNSRKPWKEPTNSTKKPAPTVPTIAAKVPAVFDIPRTNSKWICSVH